MDKTLKFVHVMILFISMFLAARNVDGRIFFRFQIPFFSFIFFVHNILSYFSNIIAFSFFHYSIH